MVIWGRVELAETEGDRLWRDATELKELTSWEVGDADRARRPLERARKAQARLWRRSSATWGGYGARRRGWVDGNGECVCGASFEEADAVRGWWGRSCLTAAGTRTGVTSAPRGSVPLVLGDDTARGEGARSPIMATKTRRIGAAPLPWRSCHSAT